MVEGLVIQAKLTEKDIKNIRESKLNMRQLAEKYSINKTTIWNIIHRNSWRHVK